MGCNAWNHPSDCDCGWGGDTGGGYGQDPLPRRSIGLSDGFINPNAQCPVCGDPVFYYESENGGKVWFDELGPPWPKHPCMTTKSAAVSSYGELLEFTGNRLEPAVAMRMAAELVKYAMTDFRYPKVELPDDDLKEARSELLDWMFRKNVKHGEHVVPLGELLQIVGYIEDGARLSVEGLPTRLALLRAVEEDKANEYREIFTKSAARGRSTLAVMAQLRAHYEREDYRGDQQLKVVKE